MYQSNDPYVAQLTDQASIHAMALTDARILTPLLIHIRHWDGDPESHDCRFQILNSKFPRSRNERERDRALDLLLQAQG